MYIEEVTVLSLSTENRQSIYEYFAVIQNLFKISFCIILDASKPTNNSHSPSHLMTSFTVAVSCFFYLDVLKINPLTLFIQRDTGQEFTNNPNYMAHI